MGSPMTTKVGAGGAMMDGPIYSSPSVQPLIDAFAKRVPRPMAPRCEQ